MLELLLNWLILSVAVWVTAVILPGVHVRSFGAAVFVAALFGVLNYVLGWLLFTVIGIATLGLGFLLAFITRWVVNTLVLKLTDALTRKLDIDTWGMAFVAALVMSGIGTLGEWLLGKVL
ncbi:MAG: phage holin family protein [Myxococcota bacterium]